MKICIKNGNIISMDESKDYILYNTDVLIDGNKIIKIDKNKLREEHSRVSTGRLRGMEISQEGLMDLYERDSDLSRKGSGKKSGTEAF